jgi:hypothetical protein
MHIVVLTQIIWNLLARGICTVSISDLYANSLCFPKKKRKLEIFGYTLWISNQMSVRCGQMPYETKQGCATAHVDTIRPSTAASDVQTRIRSCGISGGQSENGAVSQSTSVTPANFYSTNCSIFFNHHIIDALQSRTSVQIFIRLQYQEDTRQLQKLSM